MVADIWLWFTPFYVLAGIALVILAFALLARVRGGRYVRPVVETMAKVPLFKRWITRASEAALERSNPELASAMRKLQPHAKHMHDPQQAQKAMSRLTREERAAVLEMQDQQGAVPEEATNRQMRRRLEKQRRDAQRRGR